MIRILDQDDKTELEGKIKTVSDETSSLKEDLDNAVMVGFQYLNSDDAQQGKFYTGYATTSDTPDTNYFAYPIISLRRGKYYLTNISEIFTYFEDGVQLAKYPGYDKNTSTLQLSENKKVSITGFLGGLPQYIALSNVKVTNDKYGVVSVTIVGDNISERTFILEKKTSFIANNNIITVGNGKNFSTIKEAVKSITDSSKTNVYDIYIDDGTYEEYDITLPDYVNLVGASGNREKCIIKGELPDSASESDITTTSTINLMDNNVLENLTITAKNLRYPIHSESGGTHTDWRQILNNCHVEHFGNPSPNNKWIAFHAWGEGSASGAYAEFNNCTFKGPLEPWYVHEPTNVPDNPRPYYHILNNCDIINTSITSIPNWLTSVKIDNTTEKNIINTIDFNNCNFGNGSIGISGDYDINVNIHGNNNVAISRSKASNYPNTNYTIIKTYIGAEAITKNTVLMYADGINLVKKATASTPVEMIAGIATEDCEPNNLVKIIKGTYVSKTGNVGDKVYCDNNGQLANTGTIVIGTCYGQFSLVN